MKTRKEETVEIQHLDGDISRKEFDRDGGRKLGLRITESRKGGRLRPRSDGREDEEEDETRYEDGPKTTRIEDDRRF